MLYQKPNTVYQYWQKVRYQPLREDDDESLQSQQPPTSRLSVFGRWSVACVLIIWSIILLWHSVRVSSSLTTLESEKPKRWSPLQHLISYENRKFNAGLRGERTKYMGNSNESNMAWERLIRHGIILLDETDAAKLPVKTAPWNEGDGQYVVGVEMWHQLHCLNALRTSLWSQHHSPIPPTSPHMQHIDHCVDYLRQSLICHGDVGLIPFAYPDSEYVPIFNTTKECRAYDRLEKWVDEHQAGDTTPEDGPGVPHTHIPFDSTG